MDKLKFLPLELEEYLQALDPSTQNNSRSITRKNFERIIKQPTQVAQMILRKEYGINIDTDHENGRDDDGQYQKGESIN